MHFRQVKRREFITLGGGGAARAGRERLSGGKRRREFQGALGRVHSSS